MPEPDTVPANPEILAAVAAYQKAKEARGRWEAEEKRLKAEILDVLGYADDDEKPQPVNVVDPISGCVMFAVKVGSWRGMDFGHLRDAYPDVYAACETTKPTKSIKIP